MLFLLYFVFQRSDLHGGVDMDYLQHKWRELFHLLDVNMDNVLDSADMELEAADFARMNNLTDIEVRKHIWAAPRKKDP